MVAAGPSSRLPLADIAHARLLEMIMDGRLEAGAPLRVLHLAAELDTSPTPIRESLARLEGQGLVERAPMRGFTVAPRLSAAEVEELMAARSLLETRIAGEAARRIGESGLGPAIRANLAATRATEVGRTYESYREYLDLSAHFHELAAEASGNRFLRAALDALPVHVQRFRLFGPQGVTDVDVSLTEHQRIADAVIAGDVAEAEAAMAAHIDGVRLRSITELG